MWEGRVNGTTLICLESATTVTGAERERCELVMTKVIHFEPHRGGGRSIQTAIRPFTRYTIQCEEDDAISVIAEKLSRNNAQFHFRVSHVRKTVLQAIGKKRELFGHRRKLKRRIIEDTRIELVRAVEWDRNEKFQRCRSICMVILSSNWLDMYMRNYLTRMVWESRNDEEWQSWDTAQKKWKH